MSNVPSGDVVVVHIGWVRWSLSWIKANSDWIINKATDATLTSELLRYKQAMRRGGFTTNSVFCDVHHAKLCTLAHIMGNRILKSACGDGQYGHG